MEQKFSSKFFVNECIPRKQSLEQNWRQKKEDRRKEEVPGT